MEGDKGTQRRREGKRGGGQKGVREEREKREEEDGKTVQNKAEKYKSQIILFVNLFIGVSLHLLEVYMCFSSVTLLVSSGNREHQFIKLTRPGRPMVSIV